MEIQLISFTFYFNLGLMRKFNHFLAIVHLWFAVLENIGYGVNWINSSLVFAIAFQEL